MDSLRKRSPGYGEKGLHILHLYAKRFEEKMFTTATSWSDYLLKISSKMHSIETGCQCTKVNPPNQVTYIKVEAQQSDMQSVIVPKTSPKISLKRRLHQMDNDNERPNQGTETISHWRDGLHPETRQIIVNKIMNVLKRCIPYSSQEGLHDIQKRIAQRFEKKIFTIATSQCDYLRKISLKMLTMETKSQGSMTNNPNQVTNIKVEAKQSDTEHVTVPMPSPKKSLKRHHHQMNNDNGRPNQSTEGNSHWRDELHPETRQMNINNMVDSLKRHIPDSGQDVLPELHMIAQKFEEKIFNAATSWPDYLLKISSKMHSIETGCQCTKANPPNQVTYIKVEDQQSDTQSVIVPTPSPKISLKRGQHQMDNDNGRPSQGTETFSHWRNGLHPETRQINVDKLMDILKRHIPYSSQEEMQRIVQRFEEEFFTAQTSQCDYQRKKCLKMLTMEIISQGSMTNTPNQGGSRNI